MSVSFWKLLSRLGNHFVRHTCLYSSQSCSFISRLHNLFIVVIEFLSSSSSSFKSLGNGRRVQDDAVLVGGVIVAGLFIKSKSEISARVLKLETEFVHPQTFLKIQFHVRIHLTWMVCGHIFSVSKFIPVVFFGVSG